MRSQRVLLNVAAELKQLKFLRSSYWYVDRKKNRKLIVANLSQNEEGTLHKWFVTEVALIN